MEQGRRKFVSDCLCLGAGTCALASGFGIVSSVAPLSTALAAPQRVRVGETPPRLDVQRLSGSDPTDLGALRGRVVLLQFWATWCGPCRAVMPLLDNLHGQYHAQGLSVVGVSREAQRQITRHLSRSPVAYTIARDVGSTTQRYNVRSLPTLILLDRAGQAREVHTGLGRIRSLEPSIQRLLVEASP